MAFQGDLKTFPLPDLLQWLDGARKPGRLIVSHGGGERILYIGGGSIERVGAANLFEHLARIVRLLGHIDDGQLHRILERARAGTPLEKALEAEAVSGAPLKAIAREELFQSAADLFDDVSGSFHFSEDPELEQEESVGVGVSIRELLYEAARLVDEGHAASEAIAGDPTQVLPDKPADGSAKGLTLAALRAVGQGSTVGAVRLALGLSRGGAARILYELWHGHFLKVEGAAQAPEASDPLTETLRQGEKLLASGHYEAAALVFNSLLATDPSDKRLHEFARAVEREHVEALYRTLSPVAVPKLQAPAQALAALRPDERIVAALVNGVWDVSTLVLASPLRELQTLKSIERMLELNLISLA